ncbi:hypothetical protein FS837_006054 [Tulasnella sp. UAMH 9824]|nr:hypothetical protein FS837_006054 [Tulasnella sp. UAMH 9824]
MAPLADSVNAAADAAGIDRRQNDGIGLTTVQVRRLNPTYIRIKWSYHNRSPDRFTVWLRNVKTQDYYKAEANVKTSDGYKNIGLGSLGGKTGRYQIVITKYNNYNDVYARSYTFNIHKSDF